MAILYGAKTKATHKWSRIIPRVASKTRANNWDVRFGALAVSYIVSKLSMLNFSGTPPIFLPLYLPYLFVFV